MGESSVVTAKGQVTIPKFVRDALMLKSGDKIEFVVADGVLLIVPRNRPVETLFDRFASYARTPTTLRDYEDAIGEGVSDHVAPAIEHGRDAA